MGPNGFGSTRAIPPPALPASGSCAWDMAAPCSPSVQGNASAIKSGDNQLEIEVVNRLANRLIGDKQPADANVRTVECPPGLLGGQSFKAGRYTFSTKEPYNAQSALVPSGLLGPVSLLSQGDQP